MIRIFSLFVLLSLPAAASAQGSFIFNDDAAPAARVASPNSRPAKAVPAEPVDQRKTEARTCEGRCSEARPLPPKIKIERRPILSTPRNMATPIWKPFARAFAQCASYCQPIIAGIHRENHGGQSCHYSNRAIDVTGMKCGERVYRAIDEMRGRGIFSKMVACMRKKIPTIYQQPHKRHLGVTQSHYDHAHFSIGCYGGTFY